MERRRRNGENLLHQLCRAANDKKRKNKLVLAFYCGGFLRKCSEWDSLRRRTSGCLLLWVSHSVTPCVAVPCRYSWSLSRLNRRIIFLVYFIFWKGFSEPFSPWENIFSKTLETFGGKKCAVLKCKDRLFAQASHRVSRHTMDCLFCPFNEIV